MNARRQERDKYEREKKRIKRMKAGNTTHISLAILHLLLALLPVRALRTIGAGIALLQVDNRHVFFGGRLLQKVM